MDFSSFVALTALLVSIVAFVYSRRATAAAEAQARVAQEADRRAREPKLTFAVTSYARAEDWRAWIGVTNDGPTDLDSLIVLRPRTVDGVRYPVAAMSGEPDDEAELGAIPRLETRDFALFVGPGGNRPRFVIRATSRVGNETWDHAFEIPAGRVDVPRIIVGAP